jgi:hypothetical protein
MTTNSPNVWNQMSLLLKQRGFRPYPVGDTPSSAEDDYESGVDLDSTSPLTILQLVRSTMGIPMSLIDFPSFAFWDASKLQTCLENVWSALDAATSELHPETRSIVAWCYRIPPPTADEVYAIMRLAESKSPDIRAVPTSARPMSIGLIQPKSLQSAVINMIGIIRTTLDVAYGDLLAQIAGRKEGDSQTLSYLDSLLNPAQQKHALADRTSPIPALLTRAFHLATDRADPSNRIKTVAQYLSQLEEHNNLAGLSDQALTRRLIRAASDTGDSMAGRLPAQLERLVTKHLSATA